MCMHIHKVTRKVFTKTSARRSGTLKPSKQDGNYTTTLSHHSYILPTMPCVSCVHRRVAEGSGLGSAGCVVHVHGRGRNKVY